MNKEEILKKTTEEETKDIDETLPSSEEVAETEGAGVELNSNAVPTEQQQIDANIEQENSETEVPEAESESIEGDELTEEQKSVERMFTQSQVNDIAGKSRSEGHDAGRKEAITEVYTRYGVDNDAGLDEAVGKSQKYDLLREDYDNLAKELKDIKVKLAMYDSGIDPNRYDDAKFILSGKGLEITPENITAELETHPEWKKALPSPEKTGDEIQEVFKKSEVEMPEPAPKEKPISVISKLGNESAKEQSPSNDREDAMKWFR